MKTENESTQKYETLGDKLNICARFVCKTSMREVKGG